MFLIKINFFCKHIFTGFYATVTLLVINFAPWSARQVARWPVTRLAVIIKFCNYSQDCSELSVFRLVPVKPPESPGGTASSKSWLFSMLNNNLQIAQVERCLCCGWDPPCPPVLHLCLRIGITVLLLLLRKRPGLFAPSWIASYPLNS